MKIPKQPMYMLYMIIGFLLGIMCVLSINPDRVIDTNSTDIMSGEMALSIMLAIVGIGFIIGAMVIEQVNQRWIIKDLEKEIKEVRHIPFGSVIDEAISFNDGIEKAIDVVKKLRFYTK